MWGAAPLNPTNNMFRQADRATHVPGQGHSNANASFDAESQGQRARFEAMNSGFHG